MNIIENVMPFKQSKRLNNPKLIKENRNIKNKAIAIFLSSALVTAIGFGMPDDRPNYYYFNETGIVEEVTFDKEFKLYNITFDDGETAILSKDFLDEQPYEEEVTNHINVNDEDVTFIKHKGLGFKTFIPFLGELGMIGSILGGYTLIRENNEEYKEEQKRQSRQRRIEKYRRQSIKFSNRK